MNTHTQQMGVRHGNVMGVTGKKVYLPELSKRYMSNTQNILLTALIIRIKEVILLPCCLLAFNLCYQNVKTEKD